MACPRPHKPRLVGCRWAEPRVPSAPEGIRQGERPGMPLTLPNQILKEHCVEGELKPGRPISIRMDQALLQDATGTMALMQFEELGVPRVQVERAVQYIDHNVVQLDYKNPDDHRMLQAL